MDLESLQQKRTAIFASLLETEDSCQAGQPLRRKLKEINQQIRTINERKQGGSMKTELENYKNVLSEIDRIEAMAATLRAKGEALSVQQESISAEITKAEKRLQDGLIENARGFLDDESLEELQARISALKDQASFNVKKSKAVRSALAQNGSELQTVNMTRAPALTKLVMAAIAGNSEMPQKITEHIKFLWALRSRAFGANYEEFLKQLFPKPCTEETLERWRRFAADKGFKP